MDTAILTTKLHIPPLRSSLVDRSRLIARLDPGLESKLILVSAPAGYGKTTLLVEWIYSVAQRVKTAWFSIDENDNDPARFIYYLITALRMMDANLGEAALGLLNTPQPPPAQTIITTVINDISSSTTPIVLVLDDYHLVHRLEIHQLLGFLVEHQPAQLHLILLTREDPPLSLARLRANGQMIDIRQDDLRFSLTECAEFLQHVMHLDLSMADICTLERCTEGWVAGLQLAALSISGRDDLDRFIQEFSGSNQYILDYLIEEVFNRQSGEVQDFLLRTSILDRCTARLCDAVAEQNNSHAMLNLLDQINLFIIPLDKTHTWYRYHHLFADLLRQYLRSTERFSEKQLHQRANQWFAAEGLYPEAIHHAQAACDWEAAAHLIEANSELMLRRGELITLLGWMKSLPEHSIAQHPKLCRDYGWALSLTGQLEAADGYLLRAEGASQGDKTLLGTILVAQAYNQRSKGDNQGAILSSRRALDLLPFTDPLSRSLVALTMGLSHWNCGNLHESEQALKEADQAAQLSDNHYVRLTALTYLGVIQATWGRLHHAAELCRQVIQLGAGSPPTAPAFIELGALLYEWNDLPLAMQYLQTGIELSQRTGNLIIQSDGYRILALVQQAAGFAEQSLETIEKAHQLVCDQQLSPLTRYRNAACHAQLALMQGDLTCASYWHDQIIEHADASLFYPRLGVNTARLLLAQNEKAKAGAELVRLCEIAHKAGWEYGLIEVRALQAVASMQPVEALQILKNALQKAQPEGFLRCFVNKGAVMKALLRRLRAQAPDLKDYIQTILTAYGEAAFSPVHQTLIEPLSGRELEVLHLMAEGLSNDEIARRLVLGVGTIKSHIHHILEKLDCSSRTQAVTKARSLEIL